MHAPDSVNIGIGTHAAADYQQEAIGQEVQFRAPDFIAATLGQAGSTDENVCGGSP